MSGMEERTAATVLSVEEMRALLPTLPEQVHAADAHTFTVTHEGKPLFALLPWDLYESLLETVDLLSDPDAVQALRAGIAQAAQDDVADLDDVRRELGL